VRFSRLAVLEGVREVGMRLGMKGVGGGRKIKESEAMYNNKCAG